MVLKKKKKQKAKQNEIQPRHQINLAIKQANMQHLVDISMQPITFWLSNRGEIYHMID